MDIRFQGQNLVITEGIKKHLRDKLGKFEKYAKRLVDSHVVLKKEKYVFIAEITLLAKNLRAYGEAKSKENIFAAIDQAYSRVEKQLKKFREKLKDHHKTSVSESFKEAVAAKKAADSALEPSRPRVVKSRSFAAKPMSIDEASLQLAMSVKPFLVFQNALTQRVNVIFKRDDGDHGIIEPDF